MPLYEEYLRTKESKLCSYWDAALGLEPNFKPRYFLFLPHLFQTTVNSRCCLSIAIPVSAMSKSSTASSSWVYVLASIFWWKEHRVDLYLFSTPQQSLLFQGGPDFKKHAWLAQGHIQSAGSSINMPKSTNYLSSLVPHKKAHTHLYLLPGVSATMPSSSPGRKMCCLQTWVSHGWSHHEKINWLTTQSYGFGFFFLMCERKMWVSPKTLQRLQKLHVRL